VSDQAIAMTGIDGANPLGFLAALGVLVALDRASVGQPRLAWEERSRWTPVVTGLPSSDEQEISDLVAAALQGRQVTDHATDRVSQREREWQSAQRRLKEARDKLKRRGLRGSERETVIEQEIRPIEIEYEQRRREWLEALREAVPSPELALGKSLDCKPQEFRECAHALLEDGPRRRESRNALGLLAAFGSDGAVGDNNTIMSTPFCFITGSGHQYFLETARELMGRVSAERVKATLFERWRYLDEKLSMRWDPIEDRRYALMDRDPTAAGNRARTQWMANLLGYNGLALFPSAPVAGRLQTTGWSEQQAKQLAFTWPLWDRPCSLDVVRSLLGLPELISSQPNSAVLYARGVAAVFRAQRILVGSGSNRKVNFSPSRRIA